MPISSPRALTSAPPELPGIDRRVGLDEILVGRRARRSRLRPSALTMPSVTVWFSWNGLPIASTHSADLQLRRVAPRQHRQAARVDLEQRDVGPLDRRR